MDTSRKNSGSTTGKALARPRVNGAAAGRVGMTKTMVLVAAMACAAGAQDRFADVTIKATHVAGKVWMLEGRGGNIGVSVGEDGVLMVDDEFAPLADRIREAVKGLGGGELKFVLNTHWHGDHTGANPVFGREATIVAHDNVRRRLSAPQKLRNRTVESLDSKGWPVITFGDSLSVHFNGEEIRAIHCAHSHTDGDAVIVFPRSNVVHMGDLFFNGMFPFVDLDSGGSVVGLTKSVERMLAEIPPGAKIIPGHGELASLDDLKAYHRMLVGTTRVVKRGLEAGKSLSALKEAGLPEEWKPWGEGFIKTDAWIETVYRSLKER